MPKQKHGGAGEQKNRQVGEPQGGKNSDAMPGGGMGEMASLGKAISSHQPVSGHCVTLLHQAAQG
jgi:hypothetical protein